MPSPWPVFSKAGCTERPITIATNNACLESSSDTPYSESLAIVICTLFNSLSGLAGPSLKSSNIGTAHGTHDNASLSCNLVPNLSFWYFYLFLLRTTEINTSNKSPKQLRINAPIAKITMRYESWLLGTIAFNILNPIHHGIRSSWKPRCDLH